MKASTPPTRKEMIRLLNDDLSREFQAIIAYVVYSQTMKGAKYQHIAKELENTPARSSTMRSRSRSRSTTSTARP